MVYESEKIKITYSKDYIDYNLLNSFIIYIEKSLKDISNRLEYNAYKINMFLFTKDEFDIFVKNNSISYKEKEVPKWLMGFSSSECVSTVYPTADNFDEMKKVAVHECVHFIMYNMCNKSCGIKALEEGIACFLSGQDSIDKFNIIKQDYLTGSLKTIKSIINCNNIYSSTGYAYSYYIVKFLIERYSIDKFIYWYKNKNEFIKDIFELNIDILFKDYLVGLF